MGNIVIGILFEINYSILRIYAGGYHAKTRNKCMILTYTSKILCLWVCFEVSIGDKIMRDLLCVVTTVIICIAPVENENRPLNKIEFGARNINSTSQNEKFQIHISMVQ